MTRRAVVIVAILLALDLSVAAQRDQPAAAPRARVAGRVTRTDTGMPLANAVVQLRPTGGGPSRSTQTDDEGRFEITALSAGRYVLTAGADGFFAADANAIRPTGAGRLVDLKDGQQLDKIDVELVPARAIEGRVLDASGEPAPRVTVQVAQLMYAAGRMRLIPVGGGHSAGPTDDKGQYRISSLPPGDYYVMALSGPFGRSGPSAFTSPEDGLTGFAPTYYPGSDRAADAQPVHLGADDALDVTFTLVPAHMSRISGTVRDAAGAPMAHVNLMLLQVQGGDVRSIIPANTVSGTDGSFNYANVASGTYVLQGFGGSTFGVTSVTVAAPRAGEAAAFTDLTGVPVTMHPLVTARGRVSFDGDASPPPVDRVRVDFLPTDFVTGPLGGNAIPSHVNDDWTFEISRLASTGVVRATAPGWQLKSVTIDGKDVTDTPHDFQTADVTGLQIVLTSRVASARASVLDGDKPVIDAGVVVFAEDAAAWEYPSRFVSLMHPDRSGAFSVSGLLPGRYLAVAVRVLPQALDAAWLAKVRSYATRFQVAAGDVASLTLKLSPSGF